MTTADERSFTKAAKKLFITQQSLSGQISSLEREIDCKLFNRTKPLELTEAGRIFYSYATGLLNDYNRMRSALSNLTRTGSGVISIGISFPFAYILIKDSLVDIRRVAPDMQMQIVEMPGSDLIDRLRDGSLDFIIAHFPEHDPAFIRYPLYDEEAVLLVTDELLRSTYGGETEEVIRKLENGREYELLRRCPYVRSTRNNIVARFADRFIEEHGITPTAEADSFDTILEICRSGAAFSLFPYHITMSMLREKGCAPFHTFFLGESAKFSIHFGYRKNSPRSAVIEDLIRTTSSLGELRKKLQILQSADALSV